MLGASSVDEALSSLDSINRLADQDRLVIEQTRRAKQRLTRITRALAARERSLGALADEAEQSTLALEQARSERSSYLASLSNQRRLNATEISSLEQQALAVEARHAEARFGRLGAGHAAVSAPASADAR